MLIADKTYVIKVEDVIKIEGGNMGASKVNYNGYDIVVVAFSGGKDSVSCFLNLLETGCPISKIELWHHDIDGHGEDFMDWPITPDYCRAFAEAFNVPLYFSWKQGGFKGEMLRDNTATAGVSFEFPSPCATCKNVKSCGGESKSLGTRKQFPQQSPDLNQRWCSAYLKIDVASKAIIHQERFIGKRVLFITGERAQESAARSQYAEREYHKTDARSGDASKLIRSALILKILSKLAALGGDTLSLTAVKKSKKFSSKEIRLLSAEIFPAKVDKKDDPKISKSKLNDLQQQYATKHTELAEKANKAHAKRISKGQGLFRNVHAWRPMHKWTTEQVWAIIERWKVNPHPAYVLGWGRCSCAGCIFGSKDQWASLKAVLPGTFEKILKYEKQFGKTISQSRISIAEIAETGTPYAAIAANPEIVKQIGSKTYTQPIILENWVRPAGADSELDGPC